MLDMVGIRALHDKVIIDLEQVLKGYLLVADRGLSNTCSRWSRHSPRSDRIPQSSTRMSIIIVISVEGLILIIISTVQHGMAMDPKKFSLILKIINVIVGYLRLHLD